jgi:SAM-dependent methyltransferase
MSLKDVSTHFAFGENWANYAATIDERHIVEAEKALIRLFGINGLQSKTFIDIGCGSGLHAVAAGRLGATRIVAIDIDPVSAETARKVLKDHASQVVSEVHTLSVFDLVPETFGQFDVVYSWGVLHHTGDMWGAIRKAASMVGPNGLLAIALYRKTHLDRLWKLEKRLYARSPQIIQSGIRAFYIAAFRLGKLASGANFREYVANYRSSRGMDFYHNVHDWLGGYPYETTLAPEVEANLAGLGFKAERVFARAISSGILGSGCDEYVYRSIRR